MSKSDKVFHYTAVLNQDDEGNWAVSIPSLPGCYTWGETREQALLNAEEAIQGYIETLLEAGDPIPEETIPVELVPMAVAV